MKRLLIALVVLALAAGVANAATLTGTPVRIDRNDVSASRLTTFWSDDMESGENGWTHGDFTTAAPPKFHVDPYMAFGGVGNSWWCGNFDYDADGGYGNNWDEYLIIPTTDVSSAGMPVLTFAFRFDSEPGYDYTYIQAESLGVWKDLDSFDGYGAWYDHGLYGYLVDPYDNPLHARIYFSSDGSYSDADGNWPTVGGGFACDNVKVFDFNTGTVFFYDDAESGGLCVPYHIGGPFGDWWHIKSDICSSYSPPNSWWCGDDADTSVIPASIDNWLATPWIDISMASTCMFRHLLHLEIPECNEGIFCYATFDGVTYYQLFGWCGDFESCDGWAGAEYTGYDLTTLGAGWPQAQVQFLWELAASNDGIGPGLGGGAGVTIDDVWLEGDLISPVQNRSWSGIKALYR